MSPISGTVTGVYKNIGDSVRAGEPVLRVENDATILLVAIADFRGRIAIGSNVTVATPLFDAPPPKKILGKVVAVRGHGEDERWEIIVKCNNIDNGKPIFPLGYHFDFDNTTMSIS